MPDYGLKCFRMRCDVIWIHRRNDHDLVAYPARVAAIATHDAQNCRPSRLRVIERPNEIWANVSFQVAPSHRHNEHSIPLRKATRLQPLAESRVPTFIVRARGEFRDVI